MAADPQFDEWATMVDDCITREQRLTDWERDFIDNLARLLEEDQPLSAKQSDKLNIIWDRVTAKG